MHVTTIRARVKRAHGARNFGALARRGTRNSHRFDGLEALVTASAMSAEGLCASSFTRALASLRAPVDLRFRPTVSRCVHLAREQRLRNACPTTPPRPHARVEKADPERVGRGATGRSGPVCANAHFLRQRLPGCDNLVHRSVGGRAPSRSLDQSQSVAQLLLTPGR